MGALCLLLYPTSLTDCHWCHGADSLSQRHHTFCLWFTQRVELGNAWDIPEEWQPEPQQSSAVCLQGQSWSSVPKSLNTKLMTSEPLLRRAEPFRSGECCHHCLWESLRRHVHYTVQQLKASHWVEENMLHQRNAFDYPRWSRIGSFQKISIENSHWVLYENKTFEKNARVGVLCKKQENKKK